MQELRSTEILDKEIQSDARKKAEKILKKADSDAAQLISSLEQAVENAKVEKKEFYDKKISALKADKEASLPLEMQRIQVSFIQEQLYKNINSYLSTLKEEQIFELVMNSCTFTPDRNVFAYIYGFDFENTKKLLAKKIGKNLSTCKKVEFGEICTEDECGLVKKMGIILESEDRTFRLRLSLSEVLSRLLNTKRFELTECLFGGQL